MNIEPLILEGRHVRLEPLGWQHLDDLSAVAFDEAIWRWMPIPVRDQTELRGWIESALQGQRAGTMLPFITVERVSGRVVGSTRFMNMEPAHRRVEIGWSWLATPWQRTPLNTEAKLLVLRHAFDTLGCIGSS